MKNKILKRGLCLLMAVSFVLSMMAGCSQKAEAGDERRNTSADNVIITETGEVIEKSEPLIEAIPSPAQVSAAEQEIATVDPELLVEPEVIVAEMEQPEPQMEVPPEPQDNRLQIVFMGDSIFDSNRDGTGIPSRTAEQCDAKFYNLAIGGTTAAADRFAKLGWDEWTSICLLGVVNAVIGNIPTDIFEGYTAKIYLDDPNADFMNTDYFVIEYGMNDFLSAIPLTSDARYNDAKSYVGALRDAVSALKRFSPDATIILCSPTYAIFYNDGWMVGEGNMTSNGYGTLFDYKGICEYVANEQQVVFFNAYQDLGIDAYTADEYLEDGIHLTDAGRQLYADKLARMILNYEETKNN